MSDDLTVDALLERFFKQIVNFDKHLSYSNDIYYRYPSLVSGLRTYHPITVVIGHESLLEEQIQTIDASIIITISNTFKLKWYSRETKKNLITVIKNSIRHLSILIDGIIKNPKMPIAKLPLLSAEEKEQILINWNATQTLYPKDKTVVELFWEQVQRKPNHTALIYENHSVSYQSLNAQSNQLAYLLKRKGVMPHTYVVICTDDKFHLVIGLLAILKAEACYIPIDTNYPASHIQFILSDSNSTLALASKSVQAKMLNCCETQNVPLHLFEDLINESKNESDFNLPLLDSKPNSLAYIIYTSGTTGKPKGVMIPHRGISRLVKTTNYIYIRSNDRIAQAASISFDAATFEIWGALLNGATLVGVPHTTLINISQFGRFISKHGITILWLTSALFNQYAAANPSMFHMLSYLLVGGDVLNSEHIMRVLQCEKGAPKHILNGYGPTENTTFTTTYLIKPKRKVIRLFPLESLLPTQQFIF
ncbi:AMP-binding protein [Legionella tunisiensis]|uniref:AMP-binding protein n=1 Tax=Legionella tunisiensis TaxID=1034944 RepID=UPI000309D0C7|nr:AMP-binding protein [Legionella tunisiensis]